MKIKQKIDIELEFDIRQAFFIERVRGFQKESDSMIKQDLYYKNKILIMLEMFSPHQMSNKHQPSNLAYI